ncbi:hypothetical protein [Profundibacter sp.]|uniref:hypothetical protein n=1 Tax=Profundibacter sp. TaxID=3101071 RepID=UPI003D0C554D
METHVKLVTLEQAQSLPFWRRPIFLLFLMSAAMPVAFATWSALLNNFVIDKAEFTGVEIGWLHSVREIPGFLAVGVIALIVFIREQVLAAVSLLLLGVATALTAQFPSLGGILTITMLSSIGFHYYETVNQSLQLQWIDKARAPHVLGWIGAAGSAATLYVIDHMFFALAFALKTYFQKIADPQDIAPTAAVAFTINHISAVFLPALLGYLWVTSPGGVFAFAAGMAATSLALALMIPRHPEKGHETVFSRKVVAPAR